jgi:hypothetical protein
MECTLYQSAFAPTGTRLLVSRAAAGHPGSHTDHPQGMAGLDTPTIDWIADHIRQHIKQDEPLVPLFNIGVIEASTERGRVFAAC